MAFGSEIKRLREDAGLSAQKLADLIAVDAERLRKWEQNDSTPRFEDITKIEGFFNMSLDEIARLKSIKKFLNVPNQNIISEPDFQWPKKIKVSTSAKSQLKDILQTKAMVKTLLHEVAALKAKSEGREKADILMELNDKTMSNLIDLTNQK